MGQREMILGGAFWLAALIVCLIIASTPSTDCRTGHWDWKPDVNTGISALSVLELTSDNRILFDGREMSQSELAYRLTAIPGLPIQPIVVFRPANGADCGEIVRVRAMMDRFLECKEGGCAEGTEWDTQIPHGPNI